MSKLHSAPQSSGKDDDVAAMLDVMRVGLLVVQPDMTVKWGNRAAQQWSPADGARALGDFDFIDEDLVELEHAIRRAEPFAMEVQVRHAVAIVDLQVSGTPLDRDGGMLLELVDVSVMSARESRLRSLVTSDSLTGVASRWHFFELGERALADCRRYGMPLTVGMLDVDGFKGVNDACGHTVGDLVLAFVASCCAGGLRRNDVIGRLGGDEFGLLFPNTPIEAAARVADRLRQRLAEAIRESPPARVGVTLSIGVTEARSGDAKLTDVLRRADRALYRAKREGRDRIVIE